MDEGAVSASDVDLGALPVERFVIDGQVVATDVREAVDLNGLKLFFSDVLGDAGAPQNVPVGTNGDFHIDGFAPGLYRLSVALPPQSYVSSAVAGSRNVLAEGLLIDGSVNFLRIVIRTDFGGVEGQVRNQMQESVPFARIVLVPPFRDRGLYSHFPREGS